ncbi:2-hydroxyacid dehydrogenase [Paracoccus sp. Z330]|uniref:2-hydroxyacid dehydrogenase n=1 Tax=Paracoccus onchidii TaxID=3017813 RepID=A0ABT4ZA90_9RHOB|nr:2-hydroxyacid dehydrogenase [Paracoccus onchidii]MDB6176268.1 2-hydroxyacid dehydrogenase [Paracoccus onchidii]
MSRKTVLQLASLEPSDMQTQLMDNYEVLTDIDAASHAEIVVTAGNVGLSGAAMARLPALKLIAVNGVGVDAVDLPEAARRGIAVTTTPDVLSLAVAEMALALALDAGRRMSEGDRFVREGNWATKGKLGLGNSVLTRRAGILGYGRIGRSLADLLRGLGMQVTYTARSRKHDSLDSFAADPVTLAAECELLFVTAAGGSDNKGLVNAEVLRALGPDGIVINVARGPVVETQALADALSTGMIAAAGLDVFDDEPNVPQSLLNAPNCVLTPHIASATVQARRAMAQLVLDNIAAHVAQKPLPTPYKD